MRASRGAITAAIAALEAAQRDYSGGAVTALTSIRRISGRIRDAALNDNLKSVAQVASALLEADRAEEVAWLVGHLTTELQRSAAGAAQEPTVVVIVEDDRVTARVIADALENPNRIVLTAHSAAEAKRLLEEHEVSLLLLDLVLPDADGRDLLMELKSSNERRHIPILIITARADAATQAECFVLGADGVLTKPIRADVIASAVSAKLDQARERQRESRVDPLTGLPNRTAFFEALDRAIPLARRTGRPLAVAMIDMDHFKSINDEHGHATGDVVLQRSGQRISAALRISDFVARWGGEEFCAFLPNTSLNGAVVALEKALREVHGISFTGSDGHGFSVTFSAGVALLASEGAPSDALEEADRLLYLAKGAGRNRIVSTTEGALPVRPVVLLVEDDDGVARLVTRLLEREGIDVEWCADAETALLAVKSKTFALAILDVGLPNMNGFVLLRLLREQRELKALPIVMVTGSREEENVVRGFELGVNDYITKPFHAAEFVARIRRLLTRR